MVERNEEITDAKIRKGDSYRVQAQFGSRVHKILWATEYNFMTKYCPPVARRIRDCSTNLNITKLKQDFRTVIESNPDAKKQFNIFLKQNVSDPHLLDEITHIVDSQ